MPIASPPLLGPEYDDIGERVEKLAVAFTKTAEAKWTAPERGEMDVGRALVAVFEKMARHAAERINRIPERNFLAFLDRIGVTPQAARPARVPLTFSLVAAGNTEPTVPGQTRVGAKPQPGDAREIVFETERDLFTTRAKLAAVFVRQPDGDRLSERTNLAIGAQEGVFDALDAEDTAKHAWYLAVDEIFDSPAGTAVTLAFSVDDEMTWKALHAPELPPLAPDEYYKRHVPTAPLIRWTYWNGASWSALPFMSSSTLSPSFAIPPDMAATAVHGQSARWIRAELLAWPAAAIPKVHQVVASAYQQRPDTLPTVVLSNQRPVDLSLDFFPFGEQPRLNDHLLIAANGLLDRPGATVTVTITLNPSTPALAATDGPALTWEISTETGWQPVAIDVMPSNTWAGEGKIVNDVLRTLSFTVPSNAAVKTIGNTTGVWLRIRISAGSFGRGMTVYQDGIRAPVVRSILVSSSMQLTSTQPKCMAENDRGFVQQSLHAPVTPFSRAKDRDPTIFMGFDRPFSAGTVQLYVQVPPIDASRAAQEMGAAAGRVEWEYRAENGEWEPLSHEDETRGFATSGMLRFVAPNDLVPSSLFGKTLCWLRGRHRLPAGVSTISPRIGRILTNTTWARDALLRTNEVLGSADGRAGLSFQLVEHPVLEGQRIEVREPTPGEAEHEAILRSLGNDAISSEIDPRFPGQTWMKWQEVDNFQASGPRDRHYTLDHETGLVQFGDGRRGMIPPRGSHNVRAAMYATGGGICGNRAKHTVTQLKTTIPYVDGVTNHEPAMGGADAETSDEVKTWGPSVLRHGYRAITAQDFEDLALEASPAVARAKALTVEFDPVSAADNATELPTSMVAPGTLVVLIATNGMELPPAATTGLLRDVDAYLRARASSAVNLRLAGPTWIEVSVTRLEVTASSSSGAEALRGRIEDALTEFFHPIRGNVDGTGWEFGALPNASDVYRLVMSIPGVQRIGAFEWTMTTANGEPPPALDAPARARALIYPGRQMARIFAPGGA